MRRFLLVLIILLILILFVKGLEYNIPVSVTVLPIYNLSIDIDILDNKLSSGENLSVLIELEKIDLTDISKEISVDLNYEILKKKKFEIIARVYAGSLIVDDETNQTIQIPIPSDARPGRYILKIIASNPQSYSDEDSETFVVRKRYKPSFSRIFFSFFKNPNLKN